MNRHSPRAQNPFNQEIHTRHITPIDVTDIEAAPMKYVALALVQLRDEIRSLATMIADRSRLVDEYNVQSLTPESMTQITVTPIFEVGEVIESIIITGPAAGTATLQLGDRVWSLVMPASGILVIGAPLTILLSR